MRSLVLVAIMGLATVALAAEPYSWQVPQARPLPNGDLEWTPRPFVFEAGDSVRYIDFESGDDGADGTTPQTAWQHHPWDAAATGHARSAAGIHTYVFKRGVIYRGKLMARDSGEPGNPIRLTSDPAWGEGEAMIYGSQRLQGGWQRATAQDAPGIPEPERVWYNDVGDRFDPQAIRISAMWDVTGDQARRLDIARDPNWTITDPNRPWSNWHKWETFQGRIAHGILTDSQHLKGKAPDFFDGAWVWTQHKHLMGTVHRVRPRRYIPETGSFEIASPGGAQYGDSPDEPVSLNGLVHYYVENVRGYLDAPGEYYYDRTGTHPGRLYLRPAEGTDPNELVLEVPTVKSPVEIRDQNHIVISGLTFRFNDDFDDTYTLPYAIGCAPMVRVVGRCADITIKNNRFHDVMGAVTAFPRPAPEPPPGNVAEWTHGAFDNDVMDRIFITDNDVRNADQLGAIQVEGASGNEPFGKLKHVEILRNRVVNAGFRPGPSPTSSIPAISVRIPETAEIAGNIVNTSWGNGIFTIGGKGTSATNHAPLSRILIHHNLAENTMLGCNDYGGIEMFQGGPAYIYNNISRNCVGTTTFNGHELGYSLYLDGGFKIYSFNNIIHGRLDPDDPAYHNHCGYFMVFGFMDHLFNNTIYRFEYGLNGSSGNRSAVLGNVVADCSVGFMIQNRPGDVSMAYGGDTGEMGRIGIATMSYGNNVFWGQPKGEGEGGNAFGMVGGTRGAERRVENASGATIEELRAALERMQSRVSQIGWHVEDMPLADPAAGDFRPADPDSPARDRGVKFFVPWGLYGMVGEWNFYRSEHAPQVVLGEHFYMQEELVERGMYYHVPRNDLTVSQATPDDYVQGPLEDWIPGALRFDGERFAVLTHEDMTRDLVYGGGRRGEQRSDGSRRKTLDMGTNSFLIEAYFQTDAGHTDGTLAAKAEQAGYELGIDEQGRAVVRLIADGKVTASLASSKPVNDGEWHHVVAEVDRPASTIRIYLDGSQDAESKLDPSALPADASLANTGDFLVGKASDGRFFTGSLDFLRVSRGTFADAKTSYDELYAWQFDGPFLRDFAGNSPDGRRDAGALEHTGRAAGN